MLGQLAPGLNSKEVSSIDFSKPVTREEMLKALIAIHEGMLAQAKLLHITSTLTRGVPKPMRDATLASSGDLLKFSGELLKNWSAHDGT